MPETIIIQMNLIARIAQDRSSSIANNDLIQISLDSNINSSDEDDEEPFTYGPDPTISLEDLRVLSQDIDQSDAILEDLELHPAVEYSSINEENIEPSGEISIGNPLPPIIISPEEPSQLRYSTRSSLRTSRPRWDHRTHQLINPNEDVLLCQDSRSSRGSNDMIFNISVKKALKTMPEVAINSIYKEILQMSKKKVFHGVKPSFKHDKRVIKSFMFLKEKFTSDGKFDKLKARLVAGGHMQDRDFILYEDTNSPTAAIPFIMIIACIAAKEQRHVKTIDIGGAYLNADISRQEILMELDPIMSSILVDIDSTYEEFVRNNGTMVVKLNKALYGCIESAKLWNDLISSTLVSIGYSPNPMDQCIFNKVLNDIQCTIVVYVDDLLITCLELSMINEVSDLLRKSFGEITVHDNKIHSYLGMTWNFSVPFNVKITMEGFVKDLLKDCEVTGSVLTPATEQLFSTRESPPLDDEAKSMFHTQVAKLLYLAKRTRPDILLAISFLTTRVQAPDQDDLQKLKRVLKYINGTSELGLVLRTSDPMRIYAYIDASYGIHSDGKSHSALSLSLGAGSILSKSSKQKLVTKSSTEAELVAESDFASEAIFSREFLIAQGEIMPPATIFQDNMSTIAMIKNGKSKSDRTRHMNVRYFWTKERVEKGDIEIVYLSTDDMVADILTKPLQGDKFIALRQLLLNWKA
jgi:hypothetical protein